MNVAAFILNVIAVALVAFLLLNQYGSLKKQHPLVTIIVYISWFFSLLCIFILPLDISDTYYRQCKASLPLPMENITNLTITNRTSSDIDCVEPPWSAPKEVLIPLWQVVYWTSQIITWLLLPLMQSYAVAGGFTPLHKLRTAVFQNLLWYASYIVLFVIFIIYIATTVSEMSFGVIKTTMIAASNTWGLCLLIPLLGYGLIEIPRLYYIKSDLRNSLNHAYFKIAKVWQDRSEIDAELDDLIQTALKAKAQCTGFNSHFEKYVDVIIKKVPEKFLKARQNKKSSVGTNSNALTDLSLNSLEKLHEKVMSYAQRKYQIDARSQAAFRRAILLEDTIASKVQGSTFIHSFDDNTLSPNLTKIHRPSLFCTPTVEFYWRCWIQPILYKLVFVLTVLLMVFTVWSEMTFFSKDPVLSLIALFVTAAQSNGAYVAVELVTMFSLLYISLCSYFTVFKMRIMNLYHISPRHDTDESSLIFCAMLLTRLTPPICFNFLCIIQMDSSLVKSSPSAVPSSSDPGIVTSFTAIMGNLDVLPFLSAGVYIYMPVFIAIVCVATFFRAGSRCLHYLGWEQFLSSNDDMTAELIEEGRQHVLRERNRLGREVKQETRRKQLQDVGVGEPRAGASRYRPLSDGAREPTAVVNDLIGNPNENLSSSEDKSYDSFNNFANPKLAVKGRNENIFDDL